jgi:hypothetical protein
MPILSKPANAAYMALVYITVGALLSVWTVVWFVYLRNSGHQGPAYYWCAGIGLTGLTLMLIGFGVGHIGRAARSAELPPPEVTAAAARAEQTAAAHPPVVTPAQPTLGNSMPVTPGVVTTAAVPILPAVETPPVR